MAQPSPDPEENIQLPLMPLIDPTPLAVAEERQEAPALGFPAPVKHGPSSDEILALETELRSELKHSRAISQEDLDADDEELDEELDEDFEDEEDFEDDESGDDDDASTDLSVFSAVELEIRPLEEGNLPRTCYLVIDRTAELVTRPLKEFGELGAISNRDAQDRILPVFDNHRIAKRFSNRNQRIIKVPDGRMLTKTATQLQAKGITRLLIDGRVYTFGE